MNILYITNHLNIGGITSYVLTLAKGMQQKGHNVFVASSTGSAIPKFLAEGTKYTPIPIKTKNELSPKILISFFKLSRHIRQNKINIIHSNSRTTQVLGCLLRKSQKVACVSTCHGFFKPRFSRKLFPCLGNKVIAVSQPVKEHLMQDFRIKEEDIRVVQSGIDVDRFQNLQGKTGLKNKLGLGDGPVVGIIARLSQEKGHIYLVKAMQGVVQEFPLARLLIVGDGKMKQGLEGLRRELGLEKNIIFIPAVNDTLEVLPAMDIFVLPSLKEGLGLSLMEAMACQIPVVGSDIGGIKSLIQDNVNGLLVKPADAEGIARAITGLLKDREKAAKLGRQAGLFAAENFREGRMVQQTERVYLECLNAGS